MKLNQAGTFTATLRLPSDLRDMFHTSKSGSDGLILDLVTPEGEIQHVVWLTANAYNKSVETLDKCFGFDGDFAALAQGQPFPRTRCNIVTEFEEFKKNDGSTGKQLKVKWLNHVGGVEPTKDLGGVLARLARMGGKPIAQMHREAAQGTSQREMNEADPIPF